ncbi:hypothetical protein [Aeoliella mucimassa]|uniref:Chromosome partition protein Smc n=1 Tax=Aeoliella mucimassa TaxID=2527972 RepID=A0A518AH00_9BACT|nr:hypothetical protein [Aeoliella mucimassa]QDU53982.1 Chromosome partition protein Smc [Aeoliella mucimassa]
MNLIGKIFVLVIVLMSLLFMTLAMAVYSTHKNWKTAYNQLDAKYKQLDSEYKQANSAAQLTEAQLRGQLDASQSDVGRLQSERQSLIARNEDIQTEINNLKQESRDATAAVASTQANAERLSGENSVLRDNVIAANEAADESFKKTQEATGKLHDAKLELANNIESVSELTAEVARMRVLMTREGLNPDMPLDNTVPRVGGFVSSIRRRAGDEMIEITIGSDDGIRPEHTVEIFRMTNDPNQSKYLGRAQVLSTDGDRAYARILPNLKKGRIEEGDRVATRLN